MILHSYGTCQNAPVIIILLFEKVLFLTQIQFASLFTLDAGDFLVFSWH